MIHTLSLALMHVASGNSTDEMPERVSLKFHWYPAGVFSDVGESELTISTTYHVPDVVPGTWKQDGGENILDLTLAEARALHAFLGAALTINTAGDKDP